MAKDFDYLNHRFDRLEAFMILINARVELLQRALVADVGQALQNRGEYEADIVRLNRDLADILSVFEQLDDREERD